MDIGSPSESAPLKPRDRILRVCDFLFPFLFVHFISNSVLIQVRTFFLIPYTLLPILQSVAVSVLVHGGNGCICLSLSLLL